LISEHRVRCKDDTYKWVLDHGQAVGDENGNVVRMMGPMMDISERQAVQRDRAQAALELQNLRS
jgi:PAS domain-containing protein